jgi:hypothetical protein
MSRDRYLLLCDATADIKKTQLPLLLRARISGVVWQWINMSQYVLSAKVMKVRYVKNKDMDRACSMHGDIKYE